MSFCVEELWRAGIEVVADVRDSVKMAGAAMMKALADLVLTLFSRCLFSYAPVDYSHY